MGELRAVYNSLPDHEKRVFDGMSYDEGRTLRTATVAGRLKRLEEMPVLPTGDQWGERVMPVYTDRQRLKEQFDNPDPLFR